MAVINFFTLPELADELEEGALVRVEGTVKVQAGSQPSFGVRYAQVHARAMCGENLLAYMLPVGSVNTLHGEAPAVRTFSRVIPKDL